MAFQEINKQINIESVVLKAQEVLENETQCSSEPVNPDWLTRFFNCVEDISNEQMQEIWGKILAGEVKQPKSFSLRTLETLRNLRKEEAELFKKYSPLIITNQLDNYYLAGIENENYKMRIVDALLLQNCGLLNCNELRMTRSILPHEKQIWWMTDSYVVIIVNDGDKKVDFQLSVFLLSNVGKELFNVIRDEPTLYELKIVVDQVRKENKLLKCNIYQKLSANNGEITYVDKSVY